ncbi:MAG: GH92 family glycosyl hydrolase [Muribaculaceae bacterium]|nr:GH92 family glycosyl hydrolase [Muribaculaceae bacterium]
MDACYCSANTDIDVTEHVDPLIGTDFTGNTYPGAQIPFGMVQLSPDNGLSGWDRISGYFYPDSTIAGFSHTHLSGTGAGDLYDISFMPVMLPANEAEAPLGIYSRFTHDNEEAKAGYYKVNLSDYDIDVELTATERCGIQRYTFPAGDAVVILNLDKAMNWDATQDSRIVVVDSLTVEGYRFSDGWARNQRLWFRSRFSKEWDKIDVVSTPIIRDGVEIGYGEIAYFYFTTEEKEQITVSTAISCTGQEGAALNLETEVPDNDFDKYRDSAHDAWQSALSAISVDSDNEEDKTKFYTAMYHSMLAPTLYCDVDGAYMGPDGKIHNTDGWQNYETFSLWDTYRAAHPLMTYLQPQRASDFVQSLIAFGRQNGRLPVWNFQASETDMMIGYHSVPVIVDAYMKGLIPDSLANEALNSCVATANNDNYRQIGVYKKLGYVPFDLVDEHNSDNWSMSKTLEYAFDDYCIAKMADKMGRKDIADEFYVRSQNYRNVFNSETGFMQPRDTNGAFLSDFNPEDYSEHICESNAWQYLWSVQHDIDGLIELIGGSERFLNKLERMMTLQPNDSASLPIFSTGMIGQYVQGNEPSHHVIYLFNKAGRPDLTQKYIARVVNDHYDISPAGLCGNEDCGQMSAWFVFSAMGFYPVNPVSGQYEIGTPLFKAIEMKLNNGKVFRVRAPNLSKDNIYIKSIYVNGKSYDKTYITHQQIMDGATVEFEMRSNK